jgi:hypothetical protein
MERRRRWGRGALCIAVLAASACRSEIHYKQPAPVPSRDPEDQPRPDAVEGPAGLFGLAPLPADVDPLLWSRTERVDHAGAVLDVPLGEALGWAFTQDPTSRVKIRFGESRVDKELHFGGFFDANSEVTYTLYVTVALGGGPAQSVVASGRSANMTPVDSVGHAVALCVRDLHARVNNLLRAEAQNAVPPATSGEVATKPE